MTCVIVIDEDHLITFPVPVAKILAVAEIVDVQITARILSCALHLQNQIVFLVAQVNAACNNV